MRTLIAAFVLSAIAATSAAADQVTGTVLSLKAGTITFTDKSVWQLQSGQTAPEGLSPGDSLTITFDSDGDNGVIRIIDLHRKS